MKPKEEHAPSIIFTFGNSLHFDRWLNCFDNTVQSHTKTWSIILKPLLQIGVQIIYIHKNLLFVSYFTIINTVKYLTAASLALQNDLAITSDPPRRQFSVPNTI
jgi:hypothetical protein